RATPCWRGSRGQMWRSEVPRMVLRHAILLEQGCDSRFDAPYEAAGTPSSKEAFDGTVVLHLSGDGTQHRCRGRNRNRNAAADQIQKGPRAVPGLRANARMDRARGDATEGGVAHHPEKWAPVFASR